MIKELNKLRNHIRNKYKIYLIKFKTSLIKKIHYKLTFFKKMHKLKNLKYHKFNYKIH
jgi:hypothetical protein